MSEGNVMPKSFTDRIKTLTQATESEEPLFWTVLDAYNSDRDCAVDVACRDQYEAVEKMIDASGLPDDRQTALSNAVNNLYATTLRAAFACGLFAGAPGAVLLGNGKKGK